MAEEIFLKPIFTSAQPIGDVVFIHGLGGDWLFTWKALDQQNHWGEWLIEARPDLNVWSLQYPASPSRWLGRGAISLQLGAVSVLSILKEQQIGNVPICFVTHCVGGLLVKQMLMDASWADEYLEIGKMARGIVFLDTPHTGMKAADIISSLSLLLGTTELIKDIRSNSPLVLHLNQWFLSQYSKLKLRSKVFYAKRPIHGVMIIEESSSGLSLPGMKPIGVEANHFDICKHESKNVHVYKVISRFIDEVLPASSMTSENTDGNLFNDIIWDQPRQTEGVGVPLSSEMMVPLTTDTREEKPRRPSFTNILSNTLELSNTPLKIFFSYAHEDEAYKDELVKNLKMLKRQKIIQDWHDREISAGTEWKNSIDTHLEAASIILLLISTDFINSDYCYDVELQRAMERHEAGEARVIPIILRQCNWTEASFGKLLALPKNAKPIKTWDDQDEAYLDVVNGLRKVITELTNSCK